MSLPTVTSCHPLANILFQKCGGVASPSIFVVLAGLSIAIGVVLFIRNDGNGPGFAALSLSVLFIITVSSYGLMVEEVPVPQIVKQECDAVAEIVESYCAERMDDGQCREQCNWVNRTNISPIVSVRGIQYNCIQQGWIRGPTCPIR